MLSKFTSETLYIQIKTNVLSIKSVKSGEVITLQSSVPFSTKRLLIGEFSIAEKLLKEGFKKLTNSFIAPIVIVHPLENIDERLSEVEEKIFKELALSAGAKEAKLWLGKELTDDEILMT